MKVSFLSVERDRPRSIVAELSRVGRRSFTMFPFYHEPGFLFNSGSLEQLGQASWVA
jgi:hypothetical protein